MSENRHDEGAVRLPYEGPHRQPEDDPGADPDLPPLHLRLRPGRFAVELTRDGLVFGRHSSADVRLPLPDVSRRHCRFVCQDGRWHVIDLDSLNGVFVNDTLVRRAELRHGDVLRLGGFIFDVTYGPGDATVALDVGGAEPPADVIRSIAAALPPPDEGPLRRAS
jgi:pSer/pThr/pTyr-binding forkhead associated (FHA) protein